MVQLSCRRCRRETVLSQEMFEAENWGDRYIRRELADELYSRPEDVDPRLRERRR